VTAYRGTAIAALHYSGTAVSGGFLHEFGPLMGPPSGPFADVSIRSPTASAACASSGTTPSRLGEIRPRRLLHEVRARHDLSVSRIKAHTGGSSPKALGCVG